MRTSLFFIPHKFEIFGVELPVFGFGWALILWIVFSLGLLACLLRRKGQRGELLSFLPILVLVALGLVFLVPRLEEVRGGLTASEPIGLAIRGYGAMMLLGVVSAVGFAAYRARRMGIDPEVIISMAFWTFLAGIACARLWYIAQYWNEQFHKPTLGATLAALVTFTKGGLVVYGGLIGVATAFFIFVRLRKLPLLAMADIVAPCLALGLAMGRIGCFLNGCCYGGICEEPNRFHAMAVTFPKAEPSSTPYPHTMYDSPPYAHQLSFGELHGFRLGRGTDSRPLIAHLEAGFQRNRDPNSDDLKTGDVVAAINGTPVPSLADARRNKS